MTTEEEFYRLHKLLASGKINENEYLDTTGFRSMQGGTYSRNLPWADQPVVETDKTWGETVFDPMFGWLPDSVENTVRSPITPFGKTELLMDGAEKVWDGLKWVWNNTIGKWVGPEGQKMEPTLEEQQAIEAQIPSQPNAGAIADQQSVNDAFANMVANVDPSQYVIEGGMPDIDLLMSGVSDLPYGNTWDYVGNGEYNVVPDNSAAQTFANPNVYTDYFADQMINQNPGMSMVDVANNLNNDFVNSGMLSGGEYADDIQTFLGGNDPQAIADPTVLADRVASSNPFEPIVPVNTIESLQANSNNTFVTPEVPSTTTTPSVTPATGDTSGTTGGTTDMPTETYDIGELYDEEGLYTIPPPVMFPDIPSAEGVLSGIEQPGWLGYDIPDINSILPSVDWWNNMSPEVMAGIRAPYEEGSDRLMERLNSIGGLGSQRAGVSGQGAAGLGEYWADADKNIGLQAWEMTYPQLAMDWQAGLDRNITEYGYNQGLADKLYDQRLTESMYDYDNLTKGYLSNYNTMNNYRNDLLQRNMYPWSILPGMLGGSVGDTVVSNQSSSTSNALNSLGNYYLMGQMMNDDDQNYWWI
jgi:hypothetical protein